MNIWESKGKRSLPAIYDMENFLRTDLDKLFGRFLGFPISLADWKTEVLPALDINDKSDTIVVKTEIPGVDKKEIKLKLQENKLIISGEKKNEAKEDKDNYYHEERVFGRFQRVVSLPHGVETQKITADYKDGVLTITIPKPKNEEKTDINIEIE